MKQWTRTAPGQFILWLLIMMLASVAFLSGFASLYMASMDFYSLTESQLEQQAMQLRAYPDMENLTTQILYDGSMLYEAYAENQMQDRDIAYLCVTDRGQKDKVIYEYGDKKALKTGSPRFEEIFNWGAVHTAITYGDEAAQPDESLEVSDPSESDLEQAAPTPEETLVGPYTTTAVYNSENRFATQIRLVKNLWAVRYYIPAIFGVSAVMLCCLCALLLHAAGKRVGTEQVFPGFFNRIPFDIFCGLVMMAACFVVFPIDYALNSSTGDEGEMLIAMACLLAAALYLLTLALIWLHEVVNRHRLGGVWRCSILAWCWHLAGRCWRGVLRLPLIPLTTAFVLLLTLGEFMGIVLFADTEPGLLLFLWLIEKLILLPVIFYVALTCQKLRAHAHNLAQGHLEQTIDSRRMPGALKAHAEDLNSIAAAIDTAVGQRTRSERFKSELITNVSHDIKTPLTSIINYTDLICREECENPRITEYAEVLHRQSERLKKLLVDLVEASKASTGNLEVHRTPCRVDVLLDQAAGEYEQRLEQNDLHLILQKSDAGLVILADGRHLWRVFDNLMNNICKYALPGTRVYLTLAKKDTAAEVTFRNISREALNMTTDQLLERFSRGDASRTTEGSGLGLSIAQSLTELQGGTMQLSVDGDLFKVVLHFPLQGEEAPEGPAQAQPAPAEEPEAGETEITLPEE